MGVSILSDGVSHFQCILQLMMTWYQIETVINWLALRIKGVLSNIKLNTYNEAFLRNWLTAQKQSPGSVLLLWKGVLKVSKSKESTSARDCVTVVLQILRYTSGDCFRRLKAVNFFLAKKLHGNCWWVLNRPLHMIRVFNFRNNTTSFIL